MDQSLWYPDATQRPLSDHSTPGTVTQRNLIVLHITDGPTADGAIQTFASSVHPYRVSSHFVIDMDGTVYQLLPISDTAWHASAVNARSIGIEHVALSQRGADQINLQRSKKGWSTNLNCVPMPATDEQYSSSSKLLVWLAQQMNIPIDRQHIATHNEASPQDGHTGCCTDGLDPNRLVGMAKILSDPS